MANKTPPPLARSGCHAIALFFRVVKTAFNQRRKTLRNALKPLPELTGAPPAEFAGRRAEQLSVADFIALTRAIHQAPKA
jgi:16S rRNA (adenine1518-N6/adenine1519-N6)-dimethyltransferase